MISRNLVLFLFRPSYMERWNDVLRPLPLIEMDKQAHKMMIAYYLGRHEQKRRKLDFLALIEGGLFEFIYKNVTTDIKFNIYNEIQETPSHKRKLDRFVLDQVTPLLESIDGGRFLNRFIAYIKSNDESSVVKRILKAAHVYSSRFEFDLVQRINPDRYLLESNRFIERSIEKFLDLAGMERILSRTGDRNFIYLCGSLRFQARWSHLHRVPKTSVLGHSLFVAIMTYLVSLEQRFARKRKINNFLTGLFHDLPEALTRDIISPVKRGIAGMERIIKGYEKKMMEREIYERVPEFREDFQLFCEREFDDIRGSGGRIIRDGALVKAVDRFAAFVEAMEAYRNGCSALEYRQVLVENSRFDGKKGFKPYRVSGVNFHEIYQKFEPVIRHAWECIDSPLDIQ